MKRPALLIVLLALAVAACAEPIGEGEPITTRLIGAAEGGTTSTTAATTTTGATTTSSAVVTTAASTTTAPTTTTTAPSGTMGVKVYFLMAGGDTPERPGPFLVPVYREIPRTLQVATASVRALIAGPTEAERSSVPALSSAVPADSMLLGITIAGGVATVDLSREFEAGGGTFSMIARLAQVVFTVTQFPTVDSVAFRLDGEPVTVFSSEGIILDNPVSRDDYLDLLPMIFVDDPAYGAPVGNPLQVQGTGAVFEAQFNWTLTNWDGLIIAEGTAMTSEGMGWGDFDFTIPYEVDHAQNGSLIVFDYSARDGARESVREYPIQLTP
jgi:germination protein M